VHFGDEKIGFHHFISLFLSGSLVSPLAIITELESDELMRKEDGTYLKTLQLDPISEKDSGLYLCLGMNRYGYSIEKTYLNVKPSKSIIGPSSYYLTGLTSLVSFGADVRRVFIFQKKNLVTKNRFLDFFFLY
jgi:hypothetical protein